MNRQIMSSLLLRTIRIKLFLILVIIFILNITSCENGEEVKPKRITDADGNVYTAVTIGQQQWLIENLRTTRYANGDPIKYIVHDSIWNQTSEGAYCSYRNDTLFSNRYGYLYNYEAVFDNRGLAPKD